MPGRRRTAGKFRLARGGRCGSIGSIMPGLTADSWLNTRTDRPGDEVSADIFRFMADRIEAEPSLLEIPLANIARWLANGHSAVKRLEQWRTVILEAKASPAGMRKLLALLRDQSVDAVFFKEFAPTPGVLTREELARFKWTSAH